MAKGSYGSPTVKPNGFSTWWTIAVPVISFLISCLISLQITMLPTPLMDVDCELQPTRFCTRNAVRINKKLTENGTHPTGSYANEVLIVQYLTNEVNKIIADAHPSHSIEYEWQTASGNLHFSDSVLVYQSLQNLVVRFTPAGAEKESSVLINSHFDSRPNSPGAGDAGIMVAAMLETLRVLSQNQADGTFSNSLIFLFNGAEETRLRGAHAFIKKHEWAKNVKMFINLDSSGAAGRELLFQVTDDSSWILELYGRAVVHPYALVTVQELFSSGFVPSRTDFEIFRDYGHIPGIDLALSTNGYVYHTSNDLPNTIPLGTYQNIGDNLLSLAKTFGRHNLFLMYLTEEAAPDLVHHHDNEVYFDYLGWFFVRYSMTSALIINVLVPLATFTLIVVSLFAFAKRFDLSPSQIVWHFVQILIVQVFSVVLAFGVVLALAYIYDAVNGSMRWFSNIWLIGGVYYCPAVAALMVGPMLFLWWHQRLSRSSAYTLPVPVFVQICLHAHCVLLILLDWTLTGLVVQSAFMVSMIVSFYGLALLINILFKMILCDYRWMIAHLIASLPAFAYFSYFITLMLEGFVPIQGRSGSFLNPEIIIGSFTCIVAVAQFGLIAPLVCLVRRPFVVLCAVLCIFAASLVLMSTPIAFPYRPSVSEQRFMVYHTERTFYGPNLTVRRSDSGYLVHGQDRHMTRYIEDFIPELQSASNLVNDCELELMCGIAEAADGIADTGKWWTAEKSRHNEPVQLRLMNVSSVRDTVSRYHFEMEGPPTMNLFVSPVAGSKLVDWSISSLVWRSRNHWGLRDQHIVRFVNAIARVPYSFSLDIRTPSNSTNPTAMDIAVTSPCLVDESQETEDFKRLIARFPDWAQVTPCISSYSSWQF